MKRMLMRPSAALFPVVGIVSALLGSAEATAGLFFFYYVLQVLTLCAADCFRNAAGHEPGVRRVDKRFGGAIVQMLIGFALAAAGLILLEGTHMLMPLAAAGCICIEHMFEERNFALGRSTDGTMIAVISNAILLAGLLMDDNRLITKWTQSPALWAAAAGALISMVTSYAVERPRGFSLVPRNLPFAPKAMLQTLLYPALLLWIDVSVHNGLPMDDLSVLYGLLIWRLARTNCRRSADESRPLNLLLMALTAIPMIAAAWIPAIAPYGFLATLAMLCSIAVYAAPDWRICAGTASMIAALICRTAIIPMNPLPRGIAVTGFALAAVIFNLKNAFLRKVR